MPELFSSQVGKIRVDRLAHKGKLVNHRQVNKGHRAKQASRVSQDSQDSQPDLVLSGTETAIFEGDRIARLRDDFDPHTADDQSDPAQALTELLRQRIAALAHGEGGFNS